AELEPGGLVVETVGSGEHEDRRVAAGRDDAFRDLVARRPGNVSVEDGDVVGVDAQELQSGVAVTCDICRDRFQTQAVADRVRHQGLVLDEQDTHAQMLRACAYRRHIENPKRAGNTTLPRLAGWCVGFAGTVPRAWWSSSRRSPLPSAPSRPPPPPRPCPPAA